MTKYLKNASHIICETKTFIKYSIVFVAINFGEKKSYEHFMYKYKLFIIFLDNVHDRIFPLRFK